jgi:hypothetical protein
LRAIAAAGAGTRRLPIDDRDLVALTVQLPRRRQANDAGTKNTDAHDHPQG